MIAYIDAPSTLILAAVLVVAPTVWCWLPSRRPKGGR